MRLPWTLEELSSIQQRLGESMARTEESDPDIRPLPPMTEEETKEMLLAFFETATIRTLTADEATMCGQLLCNFRMAVRAAMAGRKGRYFIFGEDELARMMAKE
jgi:hypothetical protein